MKLYFWSNEKIGSILEFFISFLEFWRNEFYHQEEHIHNKTQRYGQNITWINIAHFWTVRAGRQNDPIFVGRYTPAWLKNESKLAFLEKKGNESIRKTPDSSINVINVKNYENTSISRSQHCVSKVNPTKVSAIHFQIEKRKNYSLWVQTIQCEKRKQMSSSVLVLFNQQHSIYENHVIATCINYMQLVLTSMS